ncbi:hypothetical protein [Natrinema gelatinilyticum]|uniref:hypothetical protein n=1 Tax=Natrinema gelatinilyticum TaxID=2961571 RepID=UPI0020C54348|nr:hypothetical protein [Natrinema gelatinilyticum]
MSSVIDIMPLDGEDLNPTDGAILDELHNGRCTPTFIADKHGYSSGNVRNRMTYLASHGHIEGIGGGLYKLVNDPRENVEPEPDINALQERINETQSELENIEAAFEHGDQETAQKALKRAREVLSGSSLEE